MEMTPSLACANKCVFCWRHHTNPVGKDWRWLVDSPELIVNAAIDNHQKLVNQFKGVPGVLPERLKEAATIRHCALSLVGEPIMYPYINEFVKMLHQKNISSFLVTNAQFPEKIVQMSPVTQLYVSIDASTQESLKAVDRPLFTDFWDRFLNSLRAIKDKQQRTVYRLTLLKGMNMSEIAEYAKLISIGLPTFIEIKGVTFCGKSDASTLSITNVPFHEEVRTFAEELCKYLDGRYELACEHQHSCSVLICDQKLKVDGKWHTWIDYDKFNQCINKYYEDGIPFDTLDYACPTPDWAVYGANEQGFNPSEIRIGKPRKTLAEKTKELEIKAQQQQQTTQI
jgi:tRNA wybutosine-synthesizing protein 1